MRIKEEKTNILMWWGRLRSDFFLALAFLEHTGHMAGAAYVMD